MMEAHAARSIEEGECLRTHASGCPGVTRKMEWGVGCSDAGLEFRNHREITFVISGRQTELQRS